MSNQTPSEIALPAVTRPRRIDAARHLLHPRQFRESMTVAGQPFLRNSALAGLQAALTVLIALPLVHLSSWSHLIGFASLGALVALFGRFAERGKRGGIVLQCAFWQTVGVLVMSLAAWLGAPSIMLLLLLALLSGTFFFIVTTGRFGPPGALIFVFAAGASMGHVTSASEIIERGLATAIVALLAWLICSLTEVFRHKANGDLPFPVEPLRPWNPRVVAALRIALGSAIAGLAAHVLGAAHPAWAVLGAMAVMQGSHLHISMNRALQRTLGTVAGAILVWWILQQEPSVWVIIAILAGLQFATEVIIGSNYGLGQILVTPMALLMSYLAAPYAASHTMVPERVLDTLLGAAIGIVLAVLCSSLDDRQHLANRHV
ncbi:FUSC family protein [Agrobacterium tumefaciens]|uniref:FUSC family protein n=1 Tax=Agrobacterium tumefaciens TaxID=358 RepID=UPI0021D19E98|nr:FUSC family protein [Agrobacterium tumefaciens]UXS04228.1 FUSC family protein [Agrobacterium tumefaciens]